MSSDIHLVTLYSEADQEAFTQFDRHLSALKARRFVHHFHSGKILAGDRLSALDEALDSADMVVCLLSSDFIANPELMSRAERIAAIGIVALIPIQLRPVDISGTVFEERQPLPPQRTIMTERGVSDDALTDVVRNLSTYINKKLYESSLPKTALEELLERVERACRHQEDQKQRRSDLRRKPGSDRMPNFVEVTYDDRFLVRQYIVAALLHTPEESDLESLSEILCKRYRHMDSLAYAVLVHIGNTVTPVMQQQARRLHIEIIHLTDYQGLINFTRYIQNQNRQLEEDTRYPQSLYVPHRMAYSIGIGGPEDAAEKDALTGLVDWIMEPNIQRFVLVLGEFGAGKTFLLYQLARRLNEIPGGPVPILLSMRTLEKANTLEQLVAQHLARSGMERIDLRGFRYMLEQGRIALLFDGFDELALRVSYDKAAEHLDTITQAACGVAKVVLTSRTQHFRSDAQVKTALAQRLESLPGHRAVRLLPFDDGQIRNFLLYRLQNQEQAAARFALLDEVKDLLGLSHNPRMLSFIAQLPEEQLRDAQARGEVTAAKLYEELLIWWIEYEWKRAHPPGLKDGLTKEERWSAVEYLAQLLWQQTETWIHVDHLDTAVRDALGKLKEIGAAEIGVAAQQVGAGTLLCRDAEGRFSFIHQSIMEWLVARVAVRQLPTGRTPLLGVREISPLMADFFADLGGREDVLRWARRVGMDRSASELTKLNALLVRNRLKDTLSRQNLAGQYLRGRGFANQNLEGADLRGADLRGADLRRAYLVGADLREADLRGASLLGADLTGAILQGAHLERAALLGARVEREDIEQAQCLGAALPWPAQPTSIDVMTHGSPSMDIASGEIAFSPDGTLLAVSACDNTVRLWDVDTGKELRVLTGHKDRVTSVNFSRDGKWLASGSWDNTVRMWDVGTGRELHVLMGHKGRVYSVNFSRNGQWLASGSGDEAVRLWEVETGQELRVLTGHKGSITSLSFSGDDKWLASGSEDKTVRLWMVDAGKEQHMLAGHQDSVTSVSFSRDGKWLASGSEDKTVRLWMVDTGKESHVLTGHKGTVTSVSFSQDGKWLASGSVDETIRLWEVNTSQELRVLIGHKGTVTSVSFSQDGRWLGSGSVDNTVRLWEANTGQELRVLAGHKGSVTSVSCSEDGKWLASGSRDNTVRLWEADTGKGVRVLTGHKGGVTSVSFSGNSKRLASGSVDDTVRIWEVNTGKELRMLTGHKGGVTSVSLSEDGKRLAVGAGNNTVRVWEIDTSNELRVFMGHRERVTCVSFSRNGQRLASGSWDNTVRIWDVDAGKEIRVLTGHKGRITSVSFSRDGQWLASGSGDGKVRLWEVDTRKEMSVLIGHKGSITSVCFSGDGKWLTSGSVDSTVRVWEVETGKELHVLTGHKGSVTGVAFRADGQILASGSADNTVQLWHVVSSRCLAILIPCAEGWATMTPDGHYKMGGTISGEVWHALGLCRFELGELDPYLPRSLRLQEDFSFLADLPDILDSSHKDQAIAPSTPAAMPLSHTPHDVEHTNSLSRVDSLLLFVCAALLGILLAKFIW